MFDTQKTFVIPIMSGGEKRCSVRFPSNEEWCERARKMKALRRFIGRGKSTYDAGNAASVDLDLFNRIRVDGDGVAFDEAEAGRVIARLERCEVLEIERQGNAYRVEMKVPGAKVSHFLRIPTQKDVMEYGRASVRTIDSARNQEIRMSLEPAITLHTKCVEKVDGYSEGSVTPVIHMDAALVAMLGQMESDLEDSDPED